VTAHVLRFMKHRAGTWKSWIAPAVLVAVAVTALVIGLSGKGGAISSQRIYSGIGLPLVRLLIYLSIGLLVGQMLESFGWSEKLGRWARPISGWAHLRDESGAAFVSGFVSGIVANTLLMQYHLEGKLTRKELTLTYLLNSGLPLYLVHLPTAFFVSASLAGSAGILYISLNFLAALCRSASVLLYCRYMLPRPDPSEPSRPGREEIASRSTVVRQIGRKFLDRFGRLVAYTFPVYVLVFLVNEWGFFLWMRTSIGTWISGELFPVEAAGILIATLAAEFSAGMAAAGALVQSGALTVKQTVLALIAGTIVATPIRAIRHQLPTHAGIFSLGLGSELLMLSQVLRVASLVVVAIPFLLWA